MFDIGFLEIGLIFVVALLVIGPERLPALARNVGYWIGKARKFVSSVQDDFQREVVKADELKNLLEEQSKIKDVHEILEKTVDESRKTVSIAADIAGDNESKSTEESDSVSKPTSTSKEQSANKEQTDTTENNRKNNG